MTTYSGFEVPQDGENPVDWRKEWFALADECRLLKHSEEEYRQSYEKLHESFAQEIQQRIADFLKENRKVHAIKFVREVFFNKGLKEAKDYVESHQADLIGQQIRNGELYVSHEAGLIILRRR